MIRILQVVNIMDRAGIETILMNYYRNIDRSKFQFDFLTHRMEKGVYDDEILNLGGKIYHAPRLYPQNYLDYYNYLTNFFHSHPEYKVVHSHIDTMSAFPLFLAKKNNIPILIAHSHTTKLDVDAKFLIKYTAKTLIPYIANNYFACGDLAGKFLFGKNGFKIIHNAIDLKRFKYDLTKRIKLRKKFGLENSFVIGHVGRYNYIKNQKFLISIFQEVFKKNISAKLLLIGKGEDENLLRKKVSELGLSEKILFLNDRDDVNELYQVMDIFVMPSLFEGVPVVCVEAQANGLPCIISDKISEEILLTDNIKSLSLSDNIEKWADIILSSNFNREDNSMQILRNSGYDIQIEALKLTNLYLELIYQSNLIQGEIGL